MSINVQRDEARFDLATLKNVFTISFGDSQEKETYLIWFRDFRMGRPLVERIHIHIGRVGCNIGR